MGPMGGPLETLMSAIPNFLHSGRGNPARGPGDLSGPNDPQNEPLDDGLDLAEAADQVASRMSEDEVAELLCDVAETKDVLVWLAGMVDFPPYLRGDFNRLLDRAENVHELVAMEHAALNEAPDLDGEDE